MADLVVPVRVMRARQSGNMPTALLPGQVFVDEYLGKFVFPDASTTPNAAGQYTSFVVIALKDVQAGLTAVRSLATGGTGVNAASFADLLSKIGAAERGANASITSLSGLTTPLSVAQGGLGTGTAGGGALDNVLGISGQAGGGLLSRTGAGAYSFAATDPGALLVDPVAVAAASTGISPTLDRRLTVPTCVPSGQFSRASAGYRTLSSGLLQSVAAGGIRIDHDPVTGANLGALLEESRTNLFLGSTTIANTAYWSQLNCTVAVTTAVLAPDGTQTAVKWTPSSGQTSSWIQQTPSVTATTYTQSIYARAVELTQIRVDIFDSSDSDMYVVFDLSAGTIVQTSAGNSGASVTGRISSANNGWWRCSVTATLASTSSFSAQPCRLASGTTNGSQGLYLWQPDFQQGAFPTSPIATTSAQATRAADSLVVPVTGNWFNPVEGTIFADFVAPPTGASSSGIRTVAQIDDGTASNRLAVRIDTDGVLRAYIVVAGTTAATLTIGTPTAGAAARLAVSYNGTTLAGSVNGGVAGSVVTSAALSGAVTSLRSGGPSPNDGALSSQLRRFAYLPRAVSAAVLQRMTA